MNSHFLSTLGLAMRAGKLTFGFDTVKAAVQAEFRAVEPFAPAVLPERLKFIQPEFDGGLAGSPLKYPAGRGQADFTAFGIARHGCLL